MRKFIILAVMLLVAACETVPITGRQQLSLMSDGEINSLGAREYREFLDESDVVKGTSDARLVQSVGRKIQGAVEGYFRQMGEEARLKGYRWEFSLVDSDEVNAFCLPGGKVAVYTGILPVTRNEAGLAVVMGHEVAHAIASHGNERMSQQLLVSVAGAAIGAALEDEDDPLVGAAFDIAFGLGAQVGVLLPFSRLHESEADRLGLIFMAMAGYDPHEAPKFWQRMSEKSGGDSLEFLSTHPSDETRIKDLQAAMPEALTYYSGSSQVRPAKGLEAKTSPRSNVLGGKAVPASRQSAFPRRKRPPSDRDDDD